MGRLSDSIDAHKMDIPCPKCGKEISESVGWLRTHTNMDCPHCGVNFALDASGLDEGVRKADQAMKDLERSLQRLSKR